MCIRDRYRYSSDGGKTYTDPVPLGYSVDAFMDGLFTISVEKAVTCPDGSVLAFCLRNTMLEDVCCEPWLTPTAVRSRDGGRTWEELSLIHIFFFLESLRV